MAASIPWSDYIKQAYPADENGDHWIPMIHKGKKYQFCMRPQGVFVRKNADSEKVFHQTTSRGYDLGNEIIALLYPDDQPD